MMVMLMMISAVTLAKAEEESLPPSLSPLTSPPPSLLPLDATQYPTLKVLRRACFAGTLFVCYLGRNYLPCVREMWKQCKETHPDVDTTFSGN